MFTVDNVCLFFFSSESKIYDNVLKPFDFENIQEESFKGVEKYKIVLNCLF